MDEAHCNFCQIGAQSKLTREITGDSQMEDNITHQVSRMEGLGNHHPGKFYRIQIFAIRIDMSMIMWTEHQLSFSFVTNGDGVTNANPFGLLRVQTGQKGNLQQQMHAFHYGGNMLHHDNSLISLQFKM